MHDEFIAAIHAKHKVRLTFYSKEDRRQLIRTCAPMDYGPSRTARSKTSRYHVWDYDSDTKRHPLGLIPAQIVSIVVLPETFDPAEFVHWSTATRPWHVARDWGALS